MNHQPVRSDPPFSERINDAEALELVAKTSWYHRFELRPGLETPGASWMDAGVACDGLGVPHDLSGWRALDVGAWDGAITFELERRGATAYALDIQDPDRVGLNSARRILGSKAVHFRGSVYQLPCDELTELDAIMFRGVFYHLKYPLLAFERLAAALKMGGLLYFEGEGLLHYAETLKGEKAKIDVKTLNSTGVPLCLSYPYNYRGGSNWFIPNRHCLEGWLTVAGLEVIEMKEYAEGDGQRLYGSARKVRDGELVEHPLY
jgi:tRNA (mo5U34)-methyltransferase